MSNEHEENEGHEPARLRIRNREIIEIRVGDIVENPSNYRTHDELQRESFQATVEEIGFYGYPDVYETDAGEVMLVDGALRRSHLIEHYGEDAVIEVNMTDFDSIEANKALATKDPLAAMAGVEQQKYADLLRELESESSASFQTLIGELAAREKIVLDEAIDAAPPESFAEYDEEIETQHKCPHCGYEWSGKTS